mgnify:CR=1 FL=1
MKSHFYRFALVLFLEIKHTTEHFSVQGELVIQRVMQIILHNSDLEDHGNMALIGIESSENIMQYPACFDFDDTHRFDFALDKPHLCQLVGHRRDLLGDAFTKWQSMVPGKDDFMNFRE